MMVVTMGRTYEETHPWISFSLDIRRFDHELWLLLGEAASKCEHVAGIPLAPEIAQRVHTLYLAKGAAATTAIEGNTLSEEEVERLVRGNLDLPDSQKYLADEVNNIIDACNHYTTRIASGSHTEISIELIRAMNLFVLKNLKVGEDVIPGRIREHRVVAGKYFCAPPEDIEHLLEKFCEMVNSFPVDGVNRFAYTIVKAILTHLYFVWIHPFGDGNGRTARLLELYILMSAGFPQPTGHLLSNHYNRTRARYYDFLNAAVRSEEAVIDFIRYAVRGFVEGLREQVAFIRQQQWDVAWINYVHEQFHDKNSETDVRRRHLILELSRQATPVPVSRLSKLSPLLATEYATKTGRTVIRDVNALIEMGLLERSKGVVRAKRETVQAFLPWRNNQAQ